MSDPRARFAAAFDVSRETLDQLDRYEALLRKWQAAINLVGDSTLEEFWTRHVWDSAQLVALLPEGRTITDLGAGGGFPGLVIAAMTGRAVTLVEADARKCAFLSTAARALALRYQLQNKRVEALTGPPFDIVTARAFAPLPRLLSWSRAKTAPSTDFYLLKGARWQQELDEAAVSFDFQVTAIESQTEPQARILHLTGVQQKEG